jgi:hypothetical protein
VGCFLIGKQKVVLFPTFKKNEGKKKGSCCRVFFDREVKSSFIPYI